MAIAFDWRSLIAEKTCNINANCHDIIYHFIIVKEVYYIQFSGLATLLEHHHTVVGKAKDKTTQSVIDSIIREMSPLSELVETVTLDNGKEFSGHHHITDKLGNKQQITSRFPVRKQEHRSNSILAR